jgi:hypothetical protein
MSKNKTNFDIFIKNIIMICIFVFFCFLFIIYFFNLKENLTNINFTNCVDNIPYNGSIDINELKNNDFKIYNINKGFLNNKDEIVKCDNIFNNDKTKYIFNNRDINNNNTNYYGYFSFGGNSTNNSSSLTNGSSDIVVKKTYTSSLVLGNLGSSGLNYSSYSNNDGNNNFQFQYGGIGYYQNCLNFFKNAGTPTSTGTVTSLNSVNTTNNFGLINPYYCAISFYGYFFATISGTWTFTFGTGNLANDDLSVFWIGTAGQTLSSLKLNVTESNYSFGVTYPISFNNCSYSISLISGNYYPILLNYGQSYGGSVIGFGITPPNGSLTYDGTGYFLTSIEYISNQTIFNNQTFNNIGGLILWLDALDPNNNINNIPSNNSTITKWVDKSGKGNNAIANIPIVYNTKGLNGYPALTINITQWLNGNIIIKNNTMTIFGVCSMNSTSPFAARIIGFSNSDKLHDFNNRSFMGLLRQSDTGIGPYRNGAFTSQNPTSYSTPYLFECWYDGTNGYSTVQVGERTSISSVSSSGNFAITNYTVCSNPNTSDYNSQFSGFMSEIMVFDKALSNTDRQNVEGYLSWKWGLQNNLPSSHPYKNNKPSNF